jgi:hypothetical protein
LLKVVNFTEMARSPRLMLIAPPFSLAVWPLNWHPSNVDTPLFPSTLPVGQSPARTDEMSNATTNI